MGRVRQFFMALGAKPKERDLGYLRSHLSQEEQRLFFSMHPADQAHALRVAHTAESLAEKEKVYINPELLRRAALLHDVGRKKGDMDIWGKVFAVLMFGFFPHVAGKWAEYGKERPRHLWMALPRALYVYLNHPKIGAEWISAAGAKDVAEIVERHHLPPGKDDPPELALIKKADGMN